MWRGLFEPKEFDVRARYAAARAYIVCLFYSDFLLEDFNESYLEILDSSWIIIYLCVIVSTFSKTNFDKSQLIDVYLFLEVILLQIYDILELIYLHVFSILYNYSYKYIVLIKLLLIWFLTNTAFWQPFFKKFSYLLNFFKKNK